MVPVKIQPVSVQVVPSADKLSMCPHFVESTKPSTLFTKVLRSPASVPLRAFKNALLTKSSTLPKVLVQTHMQSVKRMKSKESQRVIADRFLPQQLKRGLCKFAAEVSDPNALSKGVSLQPPTNAFSLKFTYYPPLIALFCIFTFQIRVPLNIISH